MTLPRTIRRRDARKRAKLRAVHRMAPGRYDVAATLRRVYEQHMREMTRPDSHGVFFRPRR